MKRYLAYIRVSTVRQGEQSSSLHEQRSAIETYAQRNHLAIVAWHEEMETAAKQGRQTFSRIVADLSAGRADGLIIHKIDRSARNLKDWAMLGDLIDQGIDVHFAHESLDLASRGGRLAADIQAVVAADYIRNLRDEVRKGFYGRLKQGFYPLPAPLGYRDEGAAHFKTIDPILGPLVRLAYELYVTGRYTIETLGEEMHSRGLRARNGGRLSHTGLAHVLHNPFYMGLIVIRSTGETFEGGHTPLISKRLFDEVQAVLSGRSVKGRACRSDTDFTYRKMIECAGCGRRLTGERHRYVYYRCHQPTCPGVSIREAAVDGAILEKVGALTFSQEDIKDLRDLLRGHEEVAEGERQQAAAAARMRLAQCEERYSRLTDALLDQMIDKATFDEKKAKLLLERRSLQDELEKLNAAVLTSTPLEKFENLNTPYLSLQSENPEEKRDFVETLTSKIVVEGKNLIITLRSPFLEIENCLAILSGGPGLSEGRNGDHPEEVLSALAKSLMSPKSLDEPDPFEEDGLLALRRLRTSSRRRRAKQYRCGGQHFGKACQTKSRLHR